eukprot:2077632-Amphidinium_carterae.1
MALENEKRFDFAWRHLKAFDGTWGEMLEGARLLHSKGQLFENKKGQDVEEPEEAALLMQRRQPRSLMSQKVGMTMKA